MEHPASWVDDNMADTPVFLAEAEAAQPDRLVVILVGMQVFSGGEKVSAALQERWALVVLMVDNVVILAEPPGLQVVILVEPPGLRVVILAEPPGHQVVILVDNVMILAEPPGRQVVILVDNELT